MSDDLYLYNVVVFIEKFLQKKFPIWTFQNFIILWRSVPSPNPGLSISDFIQSFIILPFMRIFIIGILLCSFFYDLSSQAQEDRGKYSSTYILYGQSDYLNVSYDYKFIGWQYDWHFPFHKDWEFIIQPNINRYDYHTGNGNKNAVRGYEAGINLNIFWKILKRNNQTQLFLQAGTGPHFLDKDLSRQAGGWMFSNNFYLGYVFFHDQQFTPAVRLGFRHISNAETKLPNGGINTISIGIGLNW